MRLVLVLAMVVGCGDNTVPWSSSGSRLKLHTYVYEDDTQQIDLTWFHDAARNERCTPTRWSDRSKYCTPDHGRAVFIDHNCGAGMGRVPAGSAPPPYFARQYHVFGVPRPSWLFRVGELTSPPSERWELRDGFCDGPFSAAGNYDYYSLGEDFPRTALVPIKLALTDFREPIALVIATTSDGLRVPHSLYDRRVGDCVPAVRPNLVATQCVPHAELISYYNDATCTEHVLSSERGTEPTLGVFHDQISNCARYFGVGTKLAAGSLYEVVGDRCVQVPAPGGQELFLISEQVQLNTLPRVHADGARLERIELTKFLFPDELLFDEVLAADCRRTELANGDIRCVPATDALVQPYFADAGCQQLIELAMVPSRECDSPVTFARRGQEIVSLAGPYTQPIYELSTGDRCGRYVPPQRFVAHAIGATVPVEMFAKASLVIAP